MHPLYHWFTVVLYFSELLGLFIVFILMLQLFYMFRPCVLKSVDKMAAMNPNLARFISNGKVERKVRDLIHIFDLITS